MPFWSRYPKGTYTRRSPEWYARGLTNWVRHMCLNEELTFEGEAAAIWFAETNIGQRMFWESLRKR